MHVVSFAFEALAFDVGMMRGGLAPLAWELARHYAAQGHRSSIVTPAHGRLPYLAERYDLVELDYRDEHVVPVVPDPDVWAGQPRELGLPLVTRAHLLRHEGVDIYLLSDEYLDLLPERLYPAGTSEGSDLAYFKPLVFQVGGLRFLQSRLAGDEPAVVQAYEPYYHYLLPPVLAGDPRFRVMSTVASSMPIDLGVYRPQVDRLLEHFGAGTDLDRYVESPVAAGADHPAATREAALGAAMAGYLPTTRLSSGRRRADYVGLFALITDHCDTVDFLTPGQRRFYSTFRDTPYEAAFRRTAVARVVRENAAKQFVGGCALPENWLRRDPAEVDRAAYLSGLGLDPALPTFYHVGRYSPHHKGQVELFRAVERILATDTRVNFVLRCATSAGGGGARIGDPAFQAVADRHPGQVRLFWTMADEDELFTEAVAADFGLFPSKYELDTFLTAQGQLCACGAVPIGTAQESTRHYRHQLATDHPLATGFALPRSFTPDDERLTGALVRTMREALRMYRDEPGEYRRLAGNAAELARTFRYAEVSRRRLAHFAKLLDGTPTAADPEHVIGCGWFDQLDAAQWAAHLPQIRREAIRLGDLETLRRCGPVDPGALGALYEAAYRRADFDRCVRVAELLGDRGSEAVSLRRRCRVRPHEQGWEIQYRAPGAEQVALVVGGTAHRMHGSAGRFSTVLPTVPMPSPVFLLTLASGRYAWDAPPATAHLADLAGQPHPAQPVGAGGR
ncbi:glycosyltransferase [Actinoplanes sp. SE50]|uniref:glycogen/starch synthase n=1 Tax=unclassified Actinoplanes TaxID=2626549 RepID=UPI00006CA2D5|nr:MULTISPECIES: glycogen/starch synthase [unclassified Actinoplanes]AEV84567.1 glycosyltransferase [Actinoplanes sp. SE50/110]ATO82959.1 glycosyltransferase [Actinoplanes sp. SE50]CAJ81027.1 glycosyltransferase AcbI [Actinoplanes sp. SE50/110]SLM00367.1 glycosyl transferase [Actinoplanes sp. SE50/110]